MKRLTRSRIISVYLKTINKHWDDITAYERSVLNSFSDELLRQVGVNDLITTDLSQDNGHLEAPTPVPTTILEDLTSMTIHYPDNKRSYKVPNTSQAAINKALTEIETYYTTRLKKCIGEMESIPHCPSKECTRNKFRAEILKAWEAERRKS